MEIQKQTNLSIALRQLSQTTLCVSLANGDYNAAALSMPTSITKATKEPPICDVIKIVGNNKVVLFVKIELIKVCERISVGNKLSTDQLEFIATQLVEMFPNESLADFKLCFERGCLGQYGDIYRMDGIVLRKWVEQYLDEKYQIIESELQQFKNVPASEEPTDTDGPGYQEFKKWAKSLQEGMKPAQMTDADYRKYGQEQPARKQTATAGYKYFTVRNVQVLALTQEHAEQLVQKMIDLGQLTEDES